MFRSQVVIRLTPNARMADTEVVEVAEEMTNGVKHPKGETLEVEPSEGRGPTGHV